MLVRMLLRWIDQKEETRKILNSKYLDLKKQRDSDDDDDANHDDADDGGDEQDHDDKDDGYA